MSKPSPTSKRRFRFQFNLLTFLILVSAIGIVAGLWMSWIEPIRSQWAAVEPLLLKHGVSVETSPSDLPDWMKSFLPNGKTENIEGLIFEETENLDSDLLKCMARLPHLKRIQLASSGLDDTHVAWVADCPTIEELFIWHDRKVTNKSVETIVNLPNLKLLDVYNTGMNWRAMTEFKKKPQLKVVQNFEFVEVENGDRVR